MPQLSLHEVEHIAQLARLGLGDVEKETFCQQLSSILDYAQMLNQLDTSGVEPTTPLAPSAPQDCRAARSLGNVMRMDTVIPGMTTAEALANAPDADAGQFRVRAILE
jgi:aspartyl-tRNA(Asn)/glutamyl-tRNA(Gln) amidotransferase subunit C